MKKLLWVGDAAVPSGFARATHGVLNELRRSYDVTVLGLNYQGDPHSYPYPIYITTFPYRDDILGVERLIWMCDRVKPDVIVFQNDFWHIPRYVAKLRLFEDYAEVPRVGFIAVDGKNVDGSTLNGLDLAIFWTQFGEREAIAGGCTIPTAVVPLGVDLNVYSVGNRVQARMNLGFNQAAAESVFIVGNVNRNQPRKRFDLAIRYFALWLKKSGVQDAFLFLHVAPTGDTGFNVKQLAKYYDIENKVILVEPPTWYGHEESVMVDTYRSFDVVLTTTQGEGFGLTTMEAAACGVPIIAPDWSALGEVLDGAAYLVPCTSTSVTVGGSVIGGVADEAATIDALDKLYYNRTLRQEIAIRGFERACEPQYRWKNIGAAFNAALSATIIESEREKELANA